MMANPKEDQFEELRGSTPQKSTLRVLGYEFDLRETGPHRALQLSGLSSERMIQILEKLRA